MVAFDTLRAAQRLRDEADQSPAAAETIAAVIGEAVTPGRDDVAALREDMAALRAEVREDMAALRAEVREDIAALRGEMREDIAALRGELREGLQAMRAEMYQLQLRLAGFAIGVAAVAVAIVKLT